MKNKRMEAELDRRSVTTLTISTLTAPTQTATDIDAGASGTAGSVDIFPATASRGKIRLTAANSAGDTTTDITNASQAGARTYTIPDAGASASFVMTEGAQTINGTKTIPAIVTTNIDAGASGTAGTVDVFPTTASKGKIQLAAADSAGDTTTTITNASQAGARTYTIPDAGASASFVMTEGAQTVNGAKTFGSAIVPTGGLGAAGGFSSSARLVHTGGQKPMLSTDGNDSTPSVTETYIAEVFIPANMTVTGVSLFNGSAAAGNVKVGLANSSGVNVAASASTAQSGTDAYQRVDFSAPYSAVGPATYYVTIQFNNTGARFNTHTFGDFGASKKTGETFGTFTTITPPTTFTTALGPMASLY